MRGRTLVIDWQEDAATLRDLYRSEKAAELKPRLHALWLLCNGHSARQVAELVGVHYVSLLHWLGRYRRGGLAEVRRHKHGGRQGRASLINALQIAQLTDQAMHGEFRTAADVRQWVAETFSAQYKRAGIDSLLNRLQDTTLETFQCRRRKQNRQIWREGAQSCLLKKS